MLSAMLPLLRSVGLLGLVVAACTGPAAAVNPLAGDDLGQGSELGAGGERRVGLPVEPAAVLGECGGVLGARDQHLNVAGDELGVVVAQLRQMPAAEGSEEAAVEHQQHVLAAVVVRQTHAGAGEVRQGEVGGRLV